MTPVRVAVVVGTRPEGIKMAPVAQVLRQDPRFNCQVVSTGQHREMLTQALQPFGVEVDHDLDVMAPGQTLAEMTAKVLTRTEQLLKEQSIDWVLVQGDTASAMAAALAGFYTHTKVGHIEAGLRSFDLASPFPEEGNRRLIGQLAHLHFAPTQGSADNLLNEGKTPASVLITGNTVIDALLHVASLTPTHNAQQIIDWATGRRMVLVTAHRRENWGERIETIFATIRELADERADLCFVCPLHLNPIVQQSGERHLANHVGIKVMNPLDYQDLVAVLSHSDLVLSDSGGIQEEAPSLDKPVLILRTETERPEVLEAGAGLLVGADRDAIREQMARLLDDSTHYRTMSEAVNPFGDGQSALRIADHVANHGLY